MANQCNDTCPLNYISSGYLYGPNNPYFPSCLYCEEMGFDESGNRIEEEATPIDENVPDYDDDYDDYRDDYRDDYDY